MEDNSCDNCNHRMVCGVMEDVRYPCQYYEQIKGSIRGGENDNC